MTGAAKTAIFRHVNVTGATMSRLPLLALLLLTAAPAIAQDNSCEYANDMECDEARYDGTGACNDGTDTADCALLAQGLSDDSCEWANDGECDEPRYANSTGACVNGTDATDCAGVELQSDALARLMDALPANLRDQLGSDNCQWANDTECDDAAFGGTGACPRDRTPPTAARWPSAATTAASGPTTTNATNPASAAAIAPRAPTPPIAPPSPGCATATTPATPPSTTPAMNPRAPAFAPCTPTPPTAKAAAAPPRRATTTSAATTASSSTTTAELPWRAIGLLTMPAGTCTGTLIGPHHVLTAAHCLTEDGKTLDLPLTFHAGLSRGVNYGKSAVVDAFFSPDYNPDTFPAGEGNGDDWGIVILADDIGLEAGCSTSTC